MNILSKIGILLLFCMGCQSIGLYAQTADVPLLQLDFESKKAVKKARLKGKYKRREAGKGKALYMQSGDTAGAHWVRLSLPEILVAGNSLSIKVKVKAENVTVPPHSYNGIKVMIKNQTPWGYDYPQVNLPQGSFDWREVTLATGIPAGSQNTELVLGLEECAGEVWFDDLEVSVVPLANGNLRKVQSPYTGHIEKRLRGMMVNTFATAEDLRTLASWGANLVRWQTTWEGFPQSKADTASLYSYKQWLDSVAGHMSQLMPLCRELGIKVVLDLHTLPGGRLDGKDEFRIFNDKYWQDAFRDIWKELALRFRDEPAIWAYDIANEPIEGTVTQGLLDWPQLAEATIKDIRQIDTAHAIIVEGRFGGQLLGLLGMKPVDDPKVVYSLHMYEPGAFTHQGVGSRPVGVSYPSVIDGVVWDKRMLETAFITVKDWQRKYNVHLYIGEFSAIRWAPGTSAYDYLRDCIEIFEEAGWDWTYHAFREWHGWSVEHTEDPNNYNVSETPTQRQQLFMEWFRKK